MKTTDLADIIEKLGQDIVRYDRKSIEAYQEKDFDASRRFHEKALALEKRVAMFLEPELFSKTKPTHSPEDSIPSFLAC